MTFDWSTVKKQKADSIRWAAFYSDCEHEVLEVTSGHRITLTYNLYLTLSPLLSAANKGSLDATQLPLYGIVKELVQCADFMKDGRFNTFQRF
jgi:hypothetical protein